MKNRALWLKTSWWRDFSLWPESDEQTNKRIYFKSISFIFWLKKGTHNDGMNGRKNNSWKSCLLKNSREKIMKATDVRYWWVKPFVLFNDNKNISPSEKFIINLSFLSARSRSEDSQLLIQLPHSLISYQMQISSNVNSHQTCFAFWFFLQHVQRDITKNVYYMIY